MSTLKPTKTSFKASLPASSAASGPSSIAASASTGGIGSIMSSLIGMSFSTTTSNDFEKNKLIVNEPKIISSYAVGQRVSARPANRDELFYTCKILEADQERQLYKVQYEDDNTIEDEIKASSIIPEVQRIVYEKDDIVVLDGHVCLPIISKSGEAETKTKRIVKKARMLAFKSTGRIVQSAILLGDNSSPTETIFDFSTLVFDINQAFSLVIPMLNINGWRSEKQRDDGLVGCILGGGAFSLPNSLAYLIPPSKLMLDVVELSPSVISTAKAYFGVPDLERKKQAQAKGKGAEKSAISINANSSSASSGDFTSLPITASTPINPYSYQVYQTDGLKFLERAIAMKRKFDFIIVDIASSAVGATEVQIEGGGMLDLPPPVFVEKDFLKNILNKSLKHDGIAVINVIADAKGLDKLSSRFREVFKMVLCFAADPNFVFFLSNRKEGSEYIDENSLLESIESIEGFEIMCPSVVKTLRKQLRDQEQGISSSSDILVGLYDIRQIKFC